MVETFTHPNAAVVKTIMHHKRGNDIAKRELVVEANIPIHTDQPGYNREQTTELLDAIQVYWVKNMDTYNYGWELTGS